MDIPGEIIIDPKTFLKEQFTLPPLPEIVLNIQKTINSSDATVNNISALIKRDPSLTAQVLKVVNSAYYGFRNEVSDIKFAVAYLGIHEIYNMVLSFSVVDTLGVNNSSELEDFWTHSIFTALCAKVLTKKFEPLLEPGQVWIGALLHDIGKLVYFKFFPAHFHAILNHAKKRGQLYEEIEKKLPIPSSAYIGTLLCQRWGLPSIVAEACEAHIPGTITAENPSINDYKKIIFGANLMAVFAAEELSSETKKKVFQTLSSLFTIEEDPLMEFMGKMYDLKKEVEKYKW